MKRIVTLILALIMCVGVFSAFGLSASATTDTVLSYLENKVLFQSDFDDPNFKFNADKTPTGDFLGFTVLDGYANDGETTKPRLIEENNSKIIKLNYVEKAGQIDFRLDKVTGTTVPQKMDTTFVLSTTIKLDAKSDNLLSFRAYQCDPRNTAWMTMFKTDGAGQIQVANGNMIKSGSNHITEAYVNSKIDAVSDYVTLECVFKHNGENFSTFEGYVNGRLFGTVAASGADITPYAALDHFRMFKGAGVSIRSVTLATVSHPLYSDICNVDFSTYADGHAASDTKYDGLQIWYETKNDSGRTHDINNGRYEITSTNENPSGAFYHDIRPYNSDNLVKSLTSGSYAFTLKFGLLGDWGNNSSNHFFRFRDTSGGSWYSGFYISNNRLFMNDTNNQTQVSDIDLSVMSAEVTWVFNYDYSSLTYKTGSCYVNGEKLGDFKISDAGVAKIDHFRMFQYDNEENAEGVYYESIRITRGTDHGYVAPTEKTDFIGYQATGVDNSLTNIRLIGIIRDADVTNYTKVGFKVTATTQSGSINITEEEKDIYEVYGKLNATTGSGYTEYTASNLGGKYIFALNCLNVPAGEAITFTVQTYYQLADGEVQYENTVKFTVDPATLPQKGVK